MAIIAITHVQGSLNNFHIGDGIIFEKGGTMLDNTKTWTVVLEYPVKPFINRITTMSEALGKLKDIDTPFSPALKMLFTQTKEAEKTAIKAKNDFELLAFHSKNKRFLLPLFTSIIGFFTGLNLNNDNSHLEKAIENLSDISQKQTHLANASLTIIKDLGNRTETLEKRVNDFYSNFNTFSGKIEAELNKVDLAFRRLIKEETTIGMLDVLLTEFLDTTTHLELICSNLLEALNGRLPIFFATTSQLRDTLIKIKSVIPAGLDFPIDINSEIYRIYHFLTVQSIYIDKDRILLAVSIPLINEKNTYTIYRMRPLYKETTHPGVYLFRKPSSNFLLSAQNSEWVTYTDDLNDCKKFSDEKYGKIYLSSKSYPLTNINASTEYQILKNINKENWGEPFLSNTFLTTIFNLDRNSWFINVKPNTTGTLVNDITGSETKLKFSNTNGTGIINIPPGDSLLIGALKLQSKLNGKSKMYLNSTTYHFTPIASEATPVMHFFKFDHFIFNTSNIEQNNKSRIFSDKLSILREKVTEIHEKEKLRESFRVHSYGLISWTTLSIGLFIAIFVILFLRRNSKITNFKNKSRQAEKDSRSKRSIKERKPLCNKTNKKIEISGPMEHKAIELTEFPPPPPPISPDPADLRQTNVAPKPPLANSFLTSDFSFLEPGVNILDSSTPGNSRQASETQQTNISTPTGQTCRVHRHKPKARRNIESDLEVTESHFNQMLQSIRNSFKRKTRTLEDLDFGSPS